MMKKKIIAYIFLAFSFAFSCVGYAAVSDTLTLRVNAEVSAPEALFITEIGEIGGSLTAVDYSIEPYTAVRSSITLGSSADSAVTMKITVWNNTDDRYGFNAVRYTSAAYDNADIAVNTDMTRKKVNNRGQVTDDGTVVEPGEYYTFTATFKYKDGVAASPELNSLVNYEFLPWDNITGDVDAGLAGDVMEQFEDVLNNVDHPDSYQMLVDQMAKSEEADRYSADYIANFTNAYGPDKEVIEQLFGTDTLKVMIDGVETEVQVIIKKENITSKYEGDEFTLYMTTHTLEKTGWATQYASPIYAAVYSVGDDGVWTMIGEMYTGEGRINGYDGSIFGDGSFDTGTWRSTQAYGSAPSGSNIETVISRNGN